MPFPHWLNLRDRDARYTAPAAALRGRGRCSGHARAARDGAPDPSGDGGCGARAAAHRHGHYLSTRDDSSGGAERHCVRVLTMTGPLILCALCGICVLDSMLQCAQVVAPKYADGVCGGDPVDTQTERQAIERARSTWRSCKSSRGGRRTSFVAAALKVRDVCDAHLML